MGQRSQIYIRYNINCVKGLIEYTLNNIDYIAENTTLMTEEEAKEFVCADYSYLFG